MSLSKAEAIESLRASWPLRDHEALREKLLKAYSSGRGYHDTVHLAEVLARVAELGEADNREVALAAWFHDAVYDGASDDEDRSARLAEEELGDVSGVDVVEVARLVRLTADHDPGPEDRNGQVICDADLAILAADQDRYLEYAAGVRADYAFVPEEDFRAGRRAVLLELLEREHLFRTDHARTAWDQQARSNLRAEIDRLR